MHLQEDNKGQTCIDRWTINLKFLHKYIISYHDYQCQAIISSKLTRQLEKGKTKKKIEKKKEKKRENSGELERQIMVMWIDKCKVEWTKNPNQQAGDTEDRLDKCTIHFLACSYIILDVITSSLFQLATISSSSWHESRRMIT